MKGFKDTDTLWGQDDASRVVPELSGRAGHTASIKGIQ
jgi:hypothetical protein